MKPNNIHYKTIKCKMKDILFDDIDYTKFFEIIEISNKIVTISYFFMRSYILYCYENENTLPILNKKFIKDTISLLTKSTGAGPKSHVDISMNEFYNKEFSTKIHNFKKINIMNMSHIIKELCDSILTSIENIIVVNYDRCLNKYIRAYVDKHYEKITKKEKKKMIYQIKNIFINNESNILDCSEWINNERPNIIPITLNINGYENDITNNVSNYVKPLIYMNKILEPQEIPLTQFFPLRKTIYPKYVTLNTPGLIDIFIKSNKNYYFRNANMLGNQLWNKYFNLKKLKLKNHVFATSIGTDGYAVSVLFIDKNDVPKLNRKIVNMRNGRTLSKKEGYIKKTHEQKVHIKINKKALYDNNKKQKKKEFKTLPKEKQDEYIQQKKLMVVFPHIEALVGNNESYEMIKKYYNDGKIIVADPGKRSELYLLGARRENEIDKISHNKRENKFKQFKFLNLTTKERLVKTKRIKYRNMINTRKYKQQINNKKIKEYENELAGYNSKTCDPTKFFEFVNKKLEINKQLSTEYNNEFYRKLKWYGYINNRRYDDEMLNKIETTFGKDILIVLGDWSMKGKLKFISTPNVRIKKKLSERFKVILIDEFNTSKYHYKHDIKCEKMKFKRYRKNRKEKNVEMNKIQKMNTVKATTIAGKIIKNVLIQSLKDEIKELHEKPIMTKIHSVLTFKMDKVMGCINRDKNAVLNMYRIVSELVKTKERPKIFQRSQCTNLLGKTLNVEKCAIVKRI